MTYKGQTTRPLFRNIHEGIIKGDVPLDTRYSTINDDKTRERIGKIAMGILNVLSGGEPLKLLNEAIDKYDKIKLEPLNTV